MTTTYWTLRDGRVAAGPLYAVAMPTKVDTYEVVALASLDSYRPLNYVLPGTVAHRNHERAKRAGTGPAHDLRLLADAAYHLACRVGPAGDRELGPVVRTLLDALVALLNQDTGGWDAGTVDAWARNTARFITEPMDE